MPRDGHSRERAGFAGLLVLDLHFPGSQSLKDKRAPLRSIKQSLRNAGYSASEVAHHDTWQRSQVAISVVARTSGDVERLLDDAQRIAERQGNDSVVRQRAVLSLDDLA